MARSTRLASQFRITAPNAKLAQQQLKKTIFLQPPTFAIAWPSGRRSGLALGPGSPFASALRQAQEAREMPPSSGSGQALRQARDRPFVRLARARGGAPGAPGRRGAGVRRRPYGFRQQAPARKGDAAVWLSPGRSPHRGCRRRLRNGGNPRQTERKSQRLEPRDASRPRVDFAGAGAVNFRRRARHLPSRGFAPGARPFATNPPLLRGTDWRIIAFPPIWEKE